MPRFTKDEMLDELRTIFLFEADHLVHGASFAMAAHFVGFELTESEYIAEDPKRVDLSRFSIAGVLESGFDFAFNPSPMNRLGGDDVQDLHAFMLGTPRSGGIASGGEQHVFMTPDGKCQSVADAAMARWKIEEFPCDFSVRELALLADMTEGAVRNAISARDGNLEPIKGSKPVAIDFDIGLAWLRSRRGFKDMPANSGNDEFLLWQIRSASTFSDLTTALWGRVLKMSDEKALVSGFEFSGPDDLATELRKLDVSRITGLADAMGLPIPLVAGRVVELALSK